MAVLQCRVCDATITEHAGPCPHCGWQPPPAMTGDQIRRRIVTRLAVGDICVGTFVACVGIFMFAVLSGVLTLNAKAASTIGVLCWVVAGCLFLGSAFFYPYYRGSRIPRNFKEDWAVIPKWLLLLGIGFLGLIAFSVVKGLIESGGEPVSLCGFACVLVWFSLFSRRAFKTRWGATPKWTRSLVLWLHLTGIAFLFLGLLVAWLRSRWAI